MTFDDTLFAFDFDGTLVPDTKFVSEEQCIKNFKTFKLSINPDFYKIKWAIVTSRPLQDKFRLVDCLRRNNSTDFIEIFTQPIYGTPIIKCQEEYDIKLNNLKAYADLFPNCKHIYYVDNDESVRQSVVNSYYIQNGNPIVDLTAISISKFITKMSALPFKN